MSISNWTCNTAGSGEWFWTYFQVGQGSRWNCRNFPEVPGFRFAHSRAGTVDGLSRQRRNRRCAEEFTREVVRRRSRITKMSSILGKNAEIVFGSRNGSSARMNGRIRIPRFTSGGSSSDPRVTDFTATTLIFLPPELGCSWYLRFFFTWNENAKFNETWTRGRR